MSDMDTELLQVVNGTNDIVPLNNPVKQVECSNPAYRDLNEINYRTRMVARAKYDPDLVFPYGMEVSPKETIFSVFETEIGYSMVGEHQNPMNVAMASELYKNHKENSAVGGVSATYPKVLTALNGLCFRYPGGPAAFDKLTPNQKIAIIRSKICIVGLIGTHNTKTHLSLGLPYFAVRYSTKAMMLNNSGDARNVIDEGFPVIANLPVPNNTSREATYTASSQYRIMGADKAKVTLIVQSLTPAVVSDIYDISKYADKGIEGIITALSYHIPAEFLRETEQQLRNSRLDEHAIAITIYNLGIMAVNNEYSRLKIGKAISAALKGHWFYIYFGQGYCN